MKITVTSENFYEAVKGGNTYDFSNYPAVIIGNAEGSGNNINLDTTIVSPENFNETAESGTIYDFENYTVVVTGQTEESGNGDDAENSGNSLTYDLTTNTVLGTYGNGIAELSLGNMAPGKLKTVAQFGVAVTSAWIVGEGYQQNFEGNNEKFIEDLKVTAATSLLAEGLMVAGGAALTAAGATITAPAWAPMVISAGIAAVLTVSWSAINSENNNGDVNLDADNNQLVNQSTGSGGRDTTNSQNQDTSTWNQHNEDGNNNTGDQPGEARVINEDGNDVPGDQPREAQLISQHDRKDDRTGRHQIVEEFDDGSTQIHYYYWDGSYGGSEYIGNGESFQYNDPRMGYKRRFDETREDNNDSREDNIDATSYDARDDQDNNDDEVVHESIDEEDEQEQDPNDNEGGGSNGNNDDDEDNDADGTDGVEGRPNPEDRPNPFENNAQGGNNRPNPFESKSNPWDDDYRPNPEDDWGVNGPNAKSLKGMKRSQIHDALMDFHADSILGQVQKMGHDDAIISGARQNKRGDFQLIFDLDGESKASGSKKLESNMIQVVTGFMDAKKNEVSDFVIETMAADSLAM